MAQAITSSEMKKLDKWAIETIGIPQIALMENAGRAVAENIAKSTAKLNVCIVAYKGNNGGDGFVAARHLVNSGRSVSVFLLCKPEEITGSAKVNFDILKNMKVPVYFGKLSILEKLLKSSDIVVDSIFGVGLKDNVEGVFAKAIELINKYQAKSKYLVVSVDIPSGINATTGKIMKHAVVAGLTVTFAYPKTGLLKSQASKYVGRLVVADIGIPK